jgi:hypothetical protein
MGIITLVLTQIQHPTRGEVFKKKINAGYIVLYRNLYMYVFEKVNKKLFQSINQTKKESFLCIFFARLLLLAYQFD